MFEASFSSRRFKSDLKRADGQEVLEKSNSSLVDSLETSEMMVRSQQNR